MAKRARKTTPKNSGTKVQKDRFQQASEAAKKAEAEAAKAAKEAEKAAAKAAKEAEAAKAEAEKEKVQTAAVKALAPIAKEVSTRLDKAAKNQQQADDHRLAAALRLAEAKEKATEAGLKFKAWAEENIKDQSFETVRKLAAVGASENPAEALAEMRERNKAANKKLRDQSGGKKSVGKKKTEAPVETALNALDKMDEGTRKRLIQSVAENEGLQVSEAGSKKAVKSDNKMLTATELKKHFLALGQQERADFVAWAQDKLNLDQQDEGEVPSFLDRRPENKRQRKTQPKKK